MQFLKDAKKYINFTIPNLVKKAFPNHKEVNKALDINLSNQRSVYKFLKKNDYGLFKVSESFNIS